MRDSDSGSQSSPVDSSSRSPRPNALTQFFDLAQILVEARVAFRSLVKSKAFSLSAILVLAIVIGANAAIFTALYDTSLKPLPYPDADRLTYVFNVADKGQQGASRGQYLAFNEEADLFEGFALINLSRMTVNQERLTGSEVTASFFDVLGVSPLVGRFFAEEESTPGSEHVLVLAESVWKSEYGSDPGVIGQSIEMNKSSYEIIGVAPDSVNRTTIGSRFYVPIAIHPWASEPQARHAYSRVSLIARLKEGVTSSAALAQLTTIETVFLETSAPAELRNRIEDSGWRLELGFPEFFLTHNLIVLQGGCVLLLLLACLNLAGLMVSRASHRSADLSVRYSLGASKATLLRSMIVESSILVGIAALLAVPVSFACIHYYNTFAMNMPGDSQALEPQVGIFAMGLPGLLLLAFALGAAPFAIMWKAGMIRSYGNTARAASSGRGVKITRSALVVAQLALSLVLLVGASLLTRSFLKTTAVDLGFDPNNVMTSRIAFSDDYATPAQRITMRDQLVESVRQIPGVDRVSCSTEFALQERARDLDVSIVDTTSDKAETAPINLKIVSREFFDTLGIEFLQGTPFDLGSGSQSPPQIVVDRSFAERHFEEGKALGARIRFGTSPESRAFPIVGVTQRANLQGQRNRDGLPILYYPIDGVPGNGFSIQVRSSRPASEITAEMRQALAKIDSGLPLYSITTLEDSLEHLVRVPRMLTQLVAAFAAVSLVISMIGLFSVISYDIAQRRRELGIRKSLGATSRQILAMIMRQAMAQIGIALTLGLGISYFSMRLLSRFLFDTPSFDLGIYLAVSVLLLLIALAASYLPSRKAASLKSLSSLQEL